MKTLNRKERRHSTTDYTDGTDKKSIFPYVKSVKSVVISPLFALFALFAVASPAARGQNSAITYAIVAQSITPAATAASDALAGLNPTYVWLNKSLASGVIGSSGWVDLSNSFAFTQHATSGGNPTQATNNTSAGAGVFFSGNASCYLTNTGILFALNQSYTIAMVVETVNNVNIAGSLGTDKAGNNGPYMAYNRRRLHRVG